MIDNLPISTPLVTRPVLKVVSKPSRLRDQIDQKKGYFISKRVFDIIFSFAFIVFIMTWLLPLIGILIKLFSKGPIFFIQKRIGKGGKSFYCFKFRTMIVNEEADIRQATDNDGRVTKFGWFLRKSNIDEFPQFFNVLMGDMSIVGPRPHMYSDCAKFGAVLPGYKFRNLVKPGLTGLAQIKGFHGPTTTLNEVLMRYHWDNYYIRNINWHQDIKIIYLTIIQRSIATFYCILQLRPFIKTRTEDSLA